MATIETSPVTTERFPPMPRHWTVEDAAAFLGVPTERIRTDPPLGTATPEDALLINERKAGPLCEWVSGLLVEKDVSSYESYLAIVLSHLIIGHLDKHQTGIVTGADGMLRIFPHRIRLPDIAYTSWDRFPNRRLPDAAVYEVVPNLVVEVISRGNRPSEMELKLDEYFAAGVELVWYIYPQSRTAIAYASVDAPQQLAEDDMLDGGKVLPGFKVRLGELFERAEAGSGPPKTD